MRFTQFLAATALIFGSFTAVAETNIAILNVQGVVLSSNMANDFKAQLEREMKPKQETMKARAEELKKMQEDGQRDADFLTDEQKRELTQNYGLKVREFQQLQESMTREQAEKEQAFVESVRPKLDSVVNTIVESRNIDLLLDRRMVLFTKQSANLDISKDVLDALNAAK